MALTLTGFGRNLCPTTALRCMAERVFGDVHLGSHFASKMAFARLVGIEDVQRAYTAAMEVGERYCRPRDPGSDT